MAASRRGPNVGTPKGLKVLVCGGRDYKDKMFLWNILDGYGPPEITEIISGMATGADAFAAEWAIKSGFKLHKYPADWKTHGKAAGMIRNRQMLVEGKPDLVIAFQGGVGTKAMVNIAEKAGVRVYKVGW